MRHPRLLLLYSSQLQMTSLRRIEFGGARSQLASPEVTLLSTKPTLANGPVKSGNPRNAPSTPNYTPWDFPNFLVNLGFPLEK